MILKKPYAFIIKHFKLIHLLLLIPIAYLIIKSHNIYAFFSNYVNNDYSFNTSILISTLSSEYVNILMYIAVILILIILIFISLILQNKNKKYKLYNLIIFYYIIIFFLITGVLSVFTMIEENNLNNTFANIVRDISFLAYYSEYLVVLYCLYRGSGFNLRHFNFTNALDLEISSEDNAEFELSINDNSYLAKRGIRRFIREIKYYFLENKFIYTIILVILSGALITYLYVNREVVNRVYNENEYAAFGYINFKVNNSYITDISLNGKEIKPDKKYLILNITLNNRSYQEREFNYKNILLVVKNNRISPVVTLENYFRDYGITYTGKKIPRDSTNNYIMIYELAKNLEAKEYMLEAYNGFDSSVGGVGVKNLNIKLNPHIVNKSLVTNNLNMNTTINLNDTNLLNSKVTIKDYSFANWFSYTVNNTINSIYINPSQDINRTLMIVDYDLLLDPECLYMGSKKDFKSFFEDFASIQYKVNDKEYTSNIKLENPNNYSEKLIFKINNNIKNAESINLNINVRDKNYSIKLK